MRDLTVEEKRSMLSVYDRMLAPEVPTLPADDWAVGYNHITPLRAAVSPPLFGREFSKALGLPVYTSQPWDNLPMYTPSSGGRIHMPRTEFFESDNEWWHALFHESAHHLHFYKHGHLDAVRWEALIGHAPNSTTGVQWKLRATTEVVAESATYLALHTLGLAPRADRSKTFIGSWAAQTKTTDEDIRAILAIAHELIETYRSVAR